MEGENDRAERALEETEDLWEAKAARGERGD